MRYIEQERHSLKQLIHFEKGAYRTKASKVSLLAHFFPGPVFYSNTAWIVFWAGHAAKQGRYGNQEWADSSHDVMTALEKIGVSIEIKGVDNFRSLDGPFVFIGNHMSALETFVLPCIIQPLKDTTFVVKESLIDYPVFGPVMRSRNPVVVGRTNPREDLKAVLNGGTEILSSGRSIVIFPQTTRAPVFNPSEFNTIGVKLAKKADVPVVPIALKTDAWGNGRRLKDFGRIDPSKKVYFSFGKPMRVKNRGVEEHNAIIAYIEEHLKKWNSEG
jgi:1-acyl-sn-glycerol-3-phosphate acyltransferase